MRGLLVEKARRKQRLRQEASIAVSIWLPNFSFQTKPTISLLSLDEAITRLTAEEPEAADVVK
jgi:hypothetical protein